MKATIYAIAVSSLVGVAVYASVVAKHDANIQAPTVIPSASTWVPLQAGFRHAPMDGMPPVVGRFYRSSSGSTRLETGPADRSVVIVSITSFEEGRMYGTLRDGTWFSYPTMITEKRRTPPVVVRNDTRARVPEPLDGFEVYKSVTNGQTRLEAPALNFLPLVVETAQFRDMYDDIELTEPDPALFRPPAGVVVTSFDDAAALREFVRNRRK